MKSNKESTSFLPYGRQDVTESDIAAVVKVLRSDWLTCGPMVKRFESAVAECCDVKHAIAVANGTAALHAACLALGVKQGDTGITSALTFLASANCIAYCGGRPDFVDIDPATGCISVEALEQYLLNNPAPAVVVPVDFAGVPADLPAVWSLAQQYGFRVVEDAAHSLGSLYEHEGKWFKCASCNHSDLAILSFHPVKTVTSGEGGMVLTNDDDLAAKVRMYANHGIERGQSLFQSWPINNATGEIVSYESSEPVETKSPWLYQQQVLGFNYRITDIQCALGLSQLKRLESCKARRRQIVEKYNSEFAGLENVVTPFEANGLDSCFHLYVPQIDFEAVGLTRPEFMKELAQRGIGSQVLYIPVYIQPWYRARYGYERGLCPNAEAYYDKTIALPLFPKMDDGMIERVVSAVKGVLSV